MPLSIITTTTQPLWTVSQSLLIMKIPHLPTWLENCWGHWPHQFYYRACKHLTHCVYLPTTQYKFHGPVIESCYQTPGTFVSSIWWGQYFKEVMDNSAFFTSKIKAAETPQCSHKGLCNEGTNFSTSSENYTTVNSVNQFDWNILFLSPNIPCFEISWQFCLVFNWFLLALSIV